MDELIQTFHIDWKLLIAQLVNFIIVVAVLWRFALRPIMKLMNDRATTIEQSLKNAEDIEKRLAQTNQEAEEKIREAKHQSTAIIETSKKQAEEKRQEILAQAKKDLEHTIAQARTQIQQEKESMLREARSELSRLIVGGVERVLGASVSESLDKKIINDRLGKLE